MIHLAFITLMVGALLAQRRIGAAAGFLCWWAALTWGTIAIHEAGHALAALRTGNDVPEVHIGVGLTLFRVGPITVGAIGFLGHTHWAANERTMTSRREAYIALGGPAANLVVALALLAIPIARTDGFGVTLIVANAATALLNLLPFQHDAHGRGASSDGARALQLLRRPPAPAT